MPSSRTTRYGFLQLVMLLSGGYFKGSGGGMDSSPVGDGVSVAWVTAGEVCCGLEQAIKDPSKMKVTQFRTRLLTKSFTELRSIGRTTEGITLSPPNIIAASPVCDGVPYRVRPAFLWAGDRTRCRSGTGVKPHRL